VNNKEFLTAVEQLDLSESALKSIVWTNLSSREKDIFLCGMKHAEKLVLEARWWQKALDSLGNAIGNAKFDQ
jgi:hypothetical protein